MFSENRFSQLQDALGCSRAESVGVLALLWLGTRSRALGRSLTREQVLRALPCGKERKEILLQALMDADYVVADGDTLQVVDNAPFFAASDKMSAAGKRGGWPAHKKHPPKKVPKPKNPLAEHTAETWRAYEGAIAQRYGVQAKRNAKVNAQLLQLVQRVGAEDAPRLVKFFVAHDGRYFVRASHPLGLLVANAEGLCVQMAREEPVTDASLQGTEGADRLQSQLRRLSGGAQ